MNEFQINLRTPQQLASLLRRTSEPAVIQAQIKLSDHEISFITNNLDILVEELAWRTVVPNSQRWAGSVNALATELRVNEPRVKEHASQIRPSVVNQLNSRLLTGELTISPDGQAFTRKNELLELVFSAFRPKQIGVIDYHGAHRNYAREELGGINLSLDQEEDRLRNTSLYNAANKYSNIKSEMAADYVKQVLRPNVPSDNPPLGTSLPIADTLQDSFGTFFPGKVFQGPVPTADGNLGFPVEMNDGSIHDINDLSSGEKEILFGYLRIRNSAPGYSIVLMDEPELHLNPALIRGLPQFYRQRLAIELENQMWSVTHSDAFLREALGHNGVQVFHMRHAETVESTENQIQEIQQGDEAESIILEMVGNLASYNPGSKVVFFEGENSEFDLRMVTRLFPTIENDLNLVSGGSRVKVEMLHKTLEESVAIRKIPIRIYSVVDRDSETAHSEVHERHYTWDMYHIENYLLEPKYIDAALGSVNLSHRDLSSLGQIDDRLRLIAKEQMKKLAVHKLNSDVYSAMREELRLGADPMSEDVGAAFFRSAVGAVERMRTKLVEELNADEMRTRVERETEILADSLESDEWKEHFRGRDILSSFVGKYVPGMRYEYFRDLVISQMASDGYQPAGMKHVLDRIIAD
ncbi:MAG: AAA family ATPase [Chloroflexi bacterium]|nr:AAA family ATPase [Chloroflexota bacterium]